MNKQLLLTVLSIFFFQTLAFSQANCGAAAPTMQPYPAGMTLCNKDTTPTPVLTFPGNGLPNLEYLIVQPDSVPGESIIIGASVNGIFSPAEYGGDVQLGERVCVVPMLYNIAQIQGLVDSLLVGVIPGMTCCQFVDFVLPNTCANLNAFGIYSGADIHSLIDMIHVFQVLNPNPLSVYTLTSTIDLLNQQGAVLPPACGGGIIPICYAIDTTQETCFSYGVRMDFAVTPVTQIGGNDGAVTVTPLSGTGPYTFLWNTGDTTSSISNLTAGTYSVTITDATGCMGIDQVAVNDICFGFEPIFQATDVTCAGAADGFITIYPYGGAPTYHVMWPNGNMVMVAQGGSAMLTGLNGGSYSCSVTDVNGCEVVYNQTVTEPAPITVEGAVSDTAYNVGDPALYFSVPYLVGGFPPYSYSWNFDDGTVVNTPTAFHSFNNIGTYNVTLTISDANGCTATDVFVIAVTGIHQLSLPGITLQPNPTQGQFVLGGLKQGYWVQIFDALGRNIKAMTATGEMLNVDLSELSDAVYFVKITSEEGMAVIKVVKE